MKKIETDILILGSGVAGLSFAIKASSLGKVIILTKAKSSDSNTFLAQGGIACVLNRNDNFERHIEDTLIAGGGHCNPFTVEYVVKKAPKMIEELMSIGVGFNKEKDQSLELGKEGGHSHNRIVHVKDQSGMAVENALLNKARSIKNIVFYEDCFAIDLVKDEKTCLGVIALDKVKNEQVFFNSRVTILATGGAGQVYEQTTNSEIATGDGYAMASNIGAQISDMEFIQFHPTVLYHPDSNGFLISEALRGFGAELVLPDGIPFMQKYHLLGSLAPRDIVSRAIYTEMQNQQLPCVYLDARSLPKKEMLNNFPSINETCLRFGINITEHLIPVVPAAHYICGGVVTDINGSTNIVNLYAIGEVACTGLHGANRLASNSLLEGLVFAENAFLHLKNNFNRLVLKDILVENSYVSDQTDHGNLTIMRHQITELMWENAGINRNMSNLKTAFEKLNNIDFSIRVLLSQHNLTPELLELRNISITAKLILDFAMKRGKSLGTHFIDNNVGAHHMLA